MEYLYVCHFSNGHIKVGRSIEPKARIAAHADRVSCVGIELVEHQIFECVASSIPAEAMLIDWCRNNCDVNHKNEWFVGTDYLSACEQAQVCAMLVTVESVDGPAMFGPAQLRLNTGRINWPWVVARLGELGVTQADIARHLSISRPSVNAIAKGQTKDLMFQNGEMLLSMLKSSEDKAISQEREAA
jgi:hypothetical protein